jgi:peptidoglycan/xylan/chitin deacetylase (PgdA/CDA1 family)
VIRAQTFLVILIVLMVIERGTGAVESDDPGVALATEVALATPPPTRVVTPPLTPKSTATPAPTPRPSPTPTAELTATPEPTPTATPLPTPTLEPTPTVRPVAPETALDYSLIIKRGDSGRKEVAFTFDAGEGRGYTEQMLDLLLQYGAVGTFGVTGMWAQQNPDLIDRMLNEGHQILNHSWDHSSFTGYSTDEPGLGIEERRWQIEATEDQIQAETGGYPSKPYFRFPYGDYDLAALEQLEDLGYTFTIGWSCDTLAWNGDPPNKIVERCGVESTLGGPGAILLFHVAQDGDWEALEPLIEDYLGAGYRLVTVEQIIQP